MTQCANPLCYKEKDLHIVHYKIADGNMIGKAWFCLEHLPDQDQILVIGMKQIDEKLIVNWQ